MSVSVTIAMFCLIQLYVPVAEELAEHKPLLKLVSIKAVGEFFPCNTALVIFLNRISCIVFLTFWQATFLSLLSMFGIVKAVRRIKLFLHCVLTV